MKKKDETVITIPTFISWEYGKNQPINGATPRKMIAVKILRLNRLFKIFFSSAPAWLIICTVTKVSPKSANTPKKAKKVMIVVYSPKPDVPR